MLFIFITLTLFPCCSISFSAETACFRIWYPMQSHRGCFFHAKRYRSASFVHALICSPKHELCFWFAGTERLSHALWRLLSSGANTRTGTVVDVISGCSNHALSFVYASQASARGARPRHSMPQPFMKRANSEDGAVQQGTQFDYVYVDVQGSVHFVTIPEHATVSFE